MPNTPVDNDPAGTTPAEPAVDPKDPTNPNPPAPASPPDPVKEALERAKKGTKTKVEKAAFSLKKNAESLRALGGDPAEVLGIPATVLSDDLGESAEDDDQPLTRGDLRRERMLQSQQTALQLADSVENEDERELAKVYLQTRIRPSGDPQKDLSDALALVNSVKNSQISQEIARKSGTATRRISSAGGSPAPAADPFEATPEEMTAARLAHVRPENMKAWIESARKGSPVVFGTAAKRKREAESKGR